jgi:hypothetical protein
MASTRVIGAMVSVVEAADRDVRTLPAMTGWTDSERLQLQRLRIAARRLLSTCLERLVGEEIRQADSPPQQS